MKKIIKITPRQKVFVREYISDPERDEVRAYKRAGYKGNGNTPYLAQRLVRKLKLIIDKELEVKGYNELTRLENEFIMHYLTIGTQAGVAKAMDISDSYAHRIFHTPRVQKALDLRAMDTMNKHQITIDKIVKEESSIAFLDPVTCINENGDLILDLRKIPEGVRRAISGIKKTENFDRNGNLIKSSAQLSFWDKGRSLERLGKHLAMYTENINIRADVNTVNKTLVVIPKPLETMEDWQKLANSYHGVETDE